MRVRSSSSIKGSPIGYQKLIDLFQVPPAVFKNLIGLNLLRPTPAEKLARNASRLVCVKGKTCRPNGKGPIPCLATARQSVSVIPRANVATMANMRPKD